MKSIRLMTLGVVTLALTVSLQPAFSAPETDKKAEAKPTTDIKSKIKALPPVADPNVKEMGKDRLRIRNLQSSAPRVEVTQPPKTRDIGIPAGTKSAEIRAITISRPLKPIVKPAVKSAVLYKTGYRDMFVKPVTAQDKANHSKPIVTDKNAVKVSSGVLTASLNKAGNQPSYKSGEKMQVNVTANQDCNLSIFNYDGKKLVQIFPNDFQKDAAVKAGETLEIGGAQSDFDYQASLSRGAKKSEERIFIYAYPTNEAPISVALNHMENAPFRDADFSIEQYRDLINQAKTAKFKSRTMAVVPKNSRKKNVQLTSAEGTTPVNTVELGFTIVDR